MVINFEQALNDTVQSLEDRGFKLPVVTAKAVCDGLSAAQQVYLSGQLEGVTVCSEYCYRLINSMRRLLNDPAAPPPTLNGYRIVERVLCHHCRIQAQDQSQQQRAEGVAREMFTRIMDKPRIVQEIADLYIATYCSLTSVDLFSDDGHPTGRAAAAARTVAEQFKGQRRAGMVRAILDDLRQMARDIDRQPAS